MERLGPSVQLTTSELTRYSRQIALSDVGIRGQQRLKAARVLVVGAGGLGCPVLQYLAAAGVGTLGIADGDTVDASNLQRQVLYTAQDVGAHKVYAAAVRLRAMNPLITVEEHPLFLTADNAEALVKNYDLVVDGSDNFPTRYLLNDTCTALDKPLVFGSILGFEGQVAVFNYKGSATYRCLYPEPPDPRDAPSCAELGVLGVLPGIVGCLQANEALKIILGTGDVLAGKLLMFNALTMSTVQLDIPRSIPALPAQTLTAPSTAETYCSPVPAKSEIAVEETAAAAATVRDISAKELAQRLSDVFLVDVRTAEESALCSLGGVLIPVDTVAERASEIPRGLPIVLYCHRGVRSRRAAALLQSYGYDNIFTLTGGIDRWATDIDPSMTRY